MRGVVFVLALLGVIWLLASGWISWQIWGLQQFCVGNACHVFLGMADRLNFIAMNATAFTWAVTPVVVTFAVLALLVFVVRELRRRKRARREEHRS